MSGAPFIGVEASSRLVRWQFFAMVAFAAAMGTKALQAAPTLYAEGPSCTNAKAALQRARGETGDTAGKHARIRIRQREVTCTCSGPQRDPVTSQQASEVGRHLAACERRELAHEAAAQRRATVARYQGARVLSCSSGRCETSAGWLSGAYGAMRARDGVRCRGVDGVLACAP